MRYAARFVPSISGVPSEGEFHLPNESQAVERFSSFHRDQEAAFQQVQAALFALDGSRVFNLLEECRLRHGRLARERTLQALHRWRSGGPAPTDETCALLFALLPNHLGDAERLRLIGGLRRQMLDRLPRDHIHFTIARAGDLADTALQIVGMMRRVREARLPADFLASQGWLARSDMAGLDALAQETERFIAVERLAELALHLGILWRIRALGVLPVSIHVRTQVEVPTASLSVRFAPGFWHAPNETDRDLLLDIQREALRQTEELEEGGCAERLLSMLTPDEQRRLRLLAAQEGLHAETLLREMRGKTVLAQQDVENVIAAAQRLHAQGRRSRTVAEFATAAGSTRIEIGSTFLSLCP